MLIIKIYRFLIGKVKLKITGDFVERFLNLCSHNGITVWGIRKRGGAIFLYMSVRDFKSLRKVVRGSGIHVKICKKRGTPFIFSRYRKRYGIAAGAVSFFLILNILSGFVWNIRVEGNENISDNTIISACEGLGIGEGVLARKLAPTEDKVDLQLAVDGIAWAALNIEGSILTVEVSEMEQPKKNDKSPCNLIANFDGVIKSVEALQGTATVTAGQAVTRGNLLVSGVVELKNGNTHFVDAKGAVMAEVFEKIKVSVPFEQNVKYIGNSSFNRFALNFFGLRIPLFLSNPKEDYLKTKSIKKLENGNAYLPIYLYKTKYRKIESRTVVLDETAALEVARKAVRNRIGDCEIIANEEKITTENDSLVLICEITTLKDIAIKENLLFNATN